MMRMSYFRGPKFITFASKSAKKAKNLHGESLHAALLDGGEEAGAAVPKGYFAVYVGAEARRFVVPTSYLCQPAFRELMERAAEEFGFDQAGGLRIPCGEEDFEEMVRALEGARQGQGGKKSKGKNAKIRLV